MKLEGRRDYSRQREGKFPVYRIGLNSAHSCLRTSSKSELSSKLASRMMVVMIGCRSERVTMVDEVHGGVSTLGVKHEAVNLCSISPYLSRFQLNTLE